MITLHLYRDRDGNAVAKIDTPEGRRTLSDGEKAKALTLLTQAGESTAYQHPREAAERRIVGVLAEMMRAKLAKRRHHGDWRRLTERQAMDLLHDEVAELLVSAHVHGDQREVIAEAVDVAACCAILIDVLRKGGA